MEYASHKIRCVVAVWHTFQMLGEGGKALLVFEEPIQVYDAYFYWFLFSWFTFPLLQHFNLQDV